MSGSPTYTMLLLGLGLRQLSVTPSAIPEIKDNRFISNINLLFRNLNSTSQLAEAIDLAMLGGFFFRGSLAAISSDQAANSGAYQSPWLRLVWRMEVRCQNPGKNNGLQTVGAQVY